MKKMKPKKYFTITFQSRQPPHGNDFHLIVAAWSQEHSCEVLAYRVLEVGKLVWLLRFQKENNGKTRERAVFIRE